MFKVMAFGLALCAVASAGSACAQETDDWEYGENPANQLSAAVTRYDTGHAFVVQCRAGELSVMVSGIPVGDAETRELDVVRTDGRRDRQSWRRENPTVIQAGLPGRAARLLRGAGIIQLRSRDGEPAVRAGFDLPTESTGVDRVLTACGRPVEDVRDTMPVFAGTLDRESVTRAMTRRDIQTPATEGPATTEVSCVVFDTLTLQDCRVEQVTPAGATFGAEVAERLTGVSVVPAAGQTAPGSVFYWSISNTSQITARQR